MPFLAKLYTDLCLKSLKLYDFRIIEQGFLILFVFLQPESIIPLKMAISKKKSRLTYESISKI